MGREMSRLRGDQIVISNYRANRLWQVANHILGCKGRMSNVLCELNGKPDPQGPPDQSKSVRTPVRTFWQGFSIDVVGMYNVPYEGRKHRFSYPFVREIMCIFGM